jgi:voltage-gated potassium channel Kch
MIMSWRNICDLLAFAPPLIEAALFRFTGYTLKGLDLRWFKILRSLRVLRVGLLGGELRSLHLSTKRGSWLNAGTNFRLFQLAASIVILLFMTTSVIAIAEQMTFHKAFYFVVTTMATVGFGDIVPVTVLGKLVVIGAILVGVVMIPVQATQFYAELVARRVVRGTLPDRGIGSPFILLSTRLSEVRAFSDFHAEFQQALRQSLFAATTKLVVLCNRPSFEFTAFQEAHERKVTLVEGSAVSSSDLVTVGAERAKALLLLADRFTTDPQQEDLSLLFQVWSAKCYTKTVPLYVQTVRQKTVSRISPFLDPEQDVIVSMEQTRLRLLALSAVCPGASTLIGNLLKSSNVRPEEAREPMLAGRRWLRAYVDGCAYQFCEAPVLKHMDGEKFINVAAWLYANSGFVAIGAIDHEERVLVNPAQLTLEKGHTLIVVGSDKKTVIRAMKDAVKVPIVSVGAVAEEPEYQQLIQRITAASSPSSDSNGTDTGTRSLGTEDEDEDEDGGTTEECIPVYMGAPDSESIDIEGDDEVCLLPTDTSAAAAAARKRPWVVMAPAASGGIPLSNHFIISGSEEGFPTLIEYLGRCMPRGQSATVVILHPAPPRGVTLGISRLGNNSNSNSKNNRGGSLGGPVIHVTGSPADSASLRAAGASTARAVIYLARTARPVKSAQATGAPVEQERSTREAVLADADALLACYGVGEASSKDGPASEITHAVVELLFTTSIEFLQPGLLLQGVSTLYDDSSTPVGAPRKSWTMRAWQQDEAVNEGLAEWQANPYYAAGRVTVPALMDTFACQCFFNQGLLKDLLGELCGEPPDDDSSSSEQNTTTSNSNNNSCSIRRIYDGALLEQMPVPRGMAGRTYGELFKAMALSSSLICLGLYRRKSENMATRLSYVVANPPANERLEVSDKVFVIRETKVE